MGRHVASVSWADDGQFATGRYSRAHELRFDGGAVVRGSSSPDVVPLPFSDPAGVDPEEALIASVSACHMLWFLNLAQQAGLIVASYRDQAEGRMGRVGRGKMAMTSIVLRPDIDFSGRAPTSAELDGLHHEAHERCFIANSVKAEITVEPPLRQAG
jgi:organic hydroperoxide reductase OsmC/OhrA